MSGCAMFQPSTNLTGIGASLALPSGAPASTQRAMVSTSALESERSLDHLPKWGSANHGGIFLSATASLMAEAQGRTCLYVSSGMGAGSPGRWHDWQFFCRIGATSLLNVTPEAPLVAAAAKLAEGTERAARPRVA